MKPGEPVLFVDPSGQTHTAFVLRERGPGRMDLDLTDGRRFEDVPSASIDGGPSWLSMEPIASPEPEPTKPVRRPVKKEQV